MRQSFWAAIPAVLILTACSPQPAEIDDQASAERLLIIGQDVEAIRGYVDAACCAQADGFTQYLMFFGLTDPEHDYGGLGLNLDDQPHTSGLVSTAGTMNAYQIGQLAGDGWLAIGLSLTENENPAAGPGALRRIAAGAHDAEIDRLGRLIDSTDATILLRVGYEFEGVWNVGYQDQGAYIAAFRHIVDRLRMTERPNLQIVWQTSASPIDDIIDGMRDDITQWYPGDAYVDWMATSLFLALDRQPTQPVPAGTPSGRDLSDELLAFARARNKPVLIAEAAPQGYDLAANTQSNIVVLLDGPSGENLRQLSSDEIWDAWFEPLFEYLHTNRDVIHGLAYINANWDAQERWGPPYNEGYWGDTRIEVNAEITDRWNHAIIKWKSAGEDDHATE